MLPTKRLQKKLRRNPVEAGPAVAPKDESGKFDPTKIAEASDFGDWEEQGCKG